MTAIKICGVTRLEDAALAAELGASFLGVILWPGSPRATSVEFAGRVSRTLPQSRVVGVFVNPTLREVTDAYRAGVRWVQIHGQEPEWADEELPLTIVRARTLDDIAPVPSSREEMVLLDAHDAVKRGGTGRTIDWVRAADVARTRNVFLAGGLTPANVAEAIRTVRPFAVDVASGVESAPGVKDHDKLRAFIAAAKETV